MAKFASLKQSKFFELKAGDSDKFASLKRNFDRSTVPSPTLTDTLFETLFVSDDDVETPPPKKSKLEVKCAELDISPGNLPMTPNKLDSAEDVSDSMSCWDAWKETVNKKHDADKDAFTEDMDNMWCMDAWTHVCQSQWPLLRY